MQPDDLQAPLRSCAVDRWPQDGQTTDVLAAEVPVALEFNGISHAVMLATPQDLEAFALGFALTEGILDSASQCYGIEVEPVQTDAVQGLAVKLDIAASCFQRLKSQRRSLAGNTGCGLCGVESLAALGPSLQVMPPQPWLAGLTVETLLRASRALPDHQPLNRACGALHAAAWVSPEGELLAVMEDVGRHNALDKLAGTLNAQSPRILIFLGGTPELAQFAQGIEKQAAQRYLVAMSDVNVVALQQLGVSRFSPVISTQSVPPVNSNLPLVRAYRDLTQTTGEPI